MTGRVLLFDFFGTLVRYTNSRTEQGYHRSHALVGDYGAAAGYEEFLRGWVEVSSEFDRRSDADDSEFSMDEACAAFLQRLLDRSPPARRPSGSSTSTSPSGTRE